MKLSSSFFTELGSPRALGGAPMNVGELGGQAGEALGGSYVGSLDGFLWGGLST